MTLDLTTVQTPTANANNHPSLSCSGVEIPEGVSDECLDLIERMLMKDPEKRISIFQILQHPFISRYNRNKTKNDWADILGSEADFLSSASSGEEEEEVRLRDSQDSPNESNPTTDVIKDKKGIVSDKSTLFSLGIKKLETTSEKTEKQARKHLAHR